MNSLLVILSMVAMASAIPLTLKSIPIQIAYERTQASSYRLKTDHPVQEPAPIIKGVPQPYAVPVPQPYAVPRAVTVEVPRPVPVTVTRTVGVPVIARGEPIVRTRVVRVDDDSDNEGLSLGGLSLGGLSLGGNNGYSSLSLGGNNGYSSLSLGGNGYGNSGDNGYGDNNGYGNSGYGDSNGLKGLSLISLGSKY